MNIIETNSPEQARKLIEKTSKNNQQVIVKGKDIEFNRKILETKNVKMLILSLSKGRDKLKERDSGLNHILAKIAQDKNIEIAVDFSEIINSEKKEKAKILSRLKQNIMLAKKFKLKLVIINKPNDKLSLAALFRILSADTKLAKNVSEK